MAVIGGMLTVIGVELIMARVPSAQLVFRTRAWGSIAAMAITFLSALFIPLQYTIFLGAALSLGLYVVASAKKVRLQQAVRLADGGWEVREAAKELKPNDVNVFVIQGLDFFAEVPALEDQIPTARGVAGAVVVLVLRDMQQITSTADPLARTLRQRAQGQRQPADAGRRQSSGAGCAEEERRAGNHWRTERLSGLGTHSGA